MTTRKRTGSPTLYNELPVNKRPHLGNARIRREIRTFDSYFSDELVVAIFSYLDFAELCTAQLVNSHWARLSCDGHLWRRLFQQDYPSQRLRGSRGFSTRWSAEGGDSGREIRPLPARLRIAGQVLWQPWKWMYRIGRNWEQGRCALEYIVDHDLQVSSTEASTSLHGGSEGHRHIVTPLLLLGGDLTFVASRLPSQSPRVTVHAPNATPHHLLPTVFRQCDAITCIALDHSQPLEIAPELMQSSSDIDFRLVTFSSSGAFSVFSIPPTNPLGSQETHQYSPSQVQFYSAPNPELSVQHAVYNHPLLITLSVSYNLSTWYIPSSGTPKRLQSFRSFTSFPPSSLSLSRTAESYKLIVTYATPVYPKHWSVAATEVKFSGQNASIRMNGVRTDRAMSSLTAWVDDEARKEMASEWSRKLVEVTAIDTDGKFVIVVSNDNTLLLYRLHYKPSFSISFVRNLVGHPDGISSTHLADGRCITEGMCGGLWVWDLDSGRCVVIDTTSSVSSRSQNGMAEGPGRNNVLSFDDRRVVTCSDKSLVKVWRFDI